MKRTKTGAYCVELTAGHFVAIDGTQAENGQVVSSGSILRLANKQGPSFAVHIEKAESGGIETRPNEVQVPLGKKVEKAIRYGAYALAAIAVAVLGTISYFHYQQQIQDAQLAALYKDLDAAKAEARKRAKTEFSPAVIDRLERAVYLVAKDEGGKPLPEATAWAFAPNLLATNAHVTEALSDHEDEFFLVAPDGAHIKIKNVVSHPGYSAFASYKTKLGTTLYGNFTPLDLINEYDVGTIEIDPKTPLPVDPTTQQPVTLKLASDEQLKALTPGTAVASAGFPSENVKGSATLTKSPPTLHFGFISSLTDVFMCRAEPANQLLIVHSVPVTGGASGSPLIDASGKVIGIVNGGNTNVIDNAGEDGKLRMSNAVQINYAQRVDLLKELDENNAHKEIAADQSYWDKMAAQFDDRFGLAVAAFKDLATSRYNVGTGKETRIGGGVLDPGNSKSIKLVQQTFEFNALPGHVYGFIADAEGGVPIALNVKKNGTDEFLRDAKDKRQSSEPDPAPTAWVTVSERTTLDVTVWSLTRLPAQFSLYAFTWEQPKTGSASQANSQPAVSQQ